MIENGAVKRAKIMTKERMNEMDETEKEERIKRIEESGINVKVLN